MWAEMLAPIGAAQCDEDHRRGRLGILGSQTIVSAITHFDAWSLSVTGILQQLQDSSKLKFQRVGMSKCLLATLGIPPLTAPSCVKLRGRLKLLPRGHPFDRTTASQAQEPCIAENPLSAFRSSSSMRKVAALCRESMTLKA